MKPETTTMPQTRIEIRDAAGRVIGTIVRPVEPQPLGPGREKVYLARRAQRPEARTPNAA